MIFCPMCRDGELVMDWSWEEVKGRQGTQGEEKS